MQVGPLAQVERLCRERRKKPVNIRPFTDALRKEGLWRKDFDSRAGGEGSAKGRDLVLRGVDWRTSQGVLGAGDNSGDRGP
jgi:hypothetical protein